MKHSKKQCVHHPYFTQSEKGGGTAAVQYIANMGNGTVAGFRHFAMEDVKSIRLEVKGTTPGSILVARDKELTDTLAEVLVQLLTGQRKICSGSVRVKNGVFPLYFKYVGEGAIDFIAFTLEAEENG